VFGRGGRITFLPYVLLFLLTVLSCMAAVPSSSTRPQATNTQEGIVIGLIGDWKTEHPVRLLSLGDSIGVGATVKPETPGKLTLWFEGRAPDDHYVCQKSPCPDQLIKLPPEPDKSPAPDRSLVDKSFELLAAIFPKEPSRYFSASSRGLEGDLKEAVLLLQGTQADIAPAFADLPAGTYWIRLDSPVESARTTGPTEVRWQPGRPALFSAAGLKPGLYRLSLLEPSGETTGSEAWILFSSSQEYAANSSAFQTVGQTVDNWPASADPSAIRAILRASLDALYEKGKSAARP